MLDRLRDKHLEKMVKYADKIKTRSLCHTSVPGWRSRAFNSVLYLYNHAKDLEEKQLALCIDMCHVYMISFNNSTGGFYDRWANMRAEFEERLEELHETDELKKLHEAYEEDNSDVGGIWVNHKERKVSFPIDRRCIPVNCKFCTHHGYLHADIFKENHYASAYICENPNAERFGLLMSGGLLCKQAVSDDDKKILSYVIHVSADMSALNEHLKMQGVDATAVLSIERRGNNLWMYYIV